MTLLSLKSIDINNIQILNKNNYYQINYNDLLTYIGICLYIPKVQFIYIHNKYKLYILDSTLLSTLQSIQTHFTKSIDNFQSFIYTDTMGSYLSFYNSIHIQNIHKQNITNICIYIKYIKSIYDKTIPIIHLYTL